MGLFSKRPTPVQVLDIHEDEQGVIATPPGVPPRPRQAEPGGPETRYKLLGRNEPEGFVAPPAMRIITEKGEFRVGDEMSLTLAEYQTLSKNAVLVPVEAL